MIEFTEGYRKHCCMPWKKCWSTAHFSFTNILSKISRIARIEQGIDCLVFRIYRIRHELTVELNFIKRVLKKNVNRAFSELNNIFQDECNKILSQQSRMPHSFYHITDSSQLNLKEIRVQNILIWPCLGIFAYDDVMM